MHDTTTTTNCSTAQFAVTNEKLVEEVNWRITAATYIMNGQLQQLATICKNIHVMPSSTGSNVAQTGTMRTASNDDRAANIVVFGLTENKNSSVWNSVLSNEMQHVAGRPVEIADAFRISKYNVNQTRPRPIIVKLRNV